MTSLLTISTFFTFLRIFLTPCIMHYIYQTAWQQAILLFICATLSDFFDGYFARRYQQETEFGKACDPVADKILLFGTLLALYQTIGHALIPAWFIITLCLKDLIILVGGLCLLRYNYPVLTPSRLSKWTTALLMLFAIYLMAVQYDIISGSYIPSILYCFTTLMSMTLFDYAYKIYKL